jgi:hypothetical protein
VNLNAEIFKNFHLIANSFWSDGGGRCIFGLGPDLNYLGGQRPLSGAFRIRHWWFRVAANPSEIWCTAITVSAISSAM